ncbi:MAG: cupin domain-containing protein [Bacteroidota bacterium]
MGANIKRIKLVDTFSEDEVSRRSTNFVKGKEVGAVAFNSCDLGTYMSYGDVPEHIHEDVEEVFYFIRGTGVVILDKKEVPVKAGSVVPVPPGIYHGVRNTGRDVLQHLVCSAKIK